MLKEKNMAKELYWEDVEVGSEIPQLIKHPTTEQLVRWAGAAEDYYPGHYDKDFALSQGFPGVTVHGKLKYAFLAQMIIDWIGDRGLLRKLRVSYRRMDFPGEPIVCKGRVTRKYIEDSEQFVECEVWTENPRGERTAQGAATIILRSRVRT